MAMKKKKITNDKRNSFHASFDTRLNFDLLKIPFLMHCRFLLALGFYSMFPWTFRISIGTKESTNLSTFERFVLLVGRPALTGPHVYNATTRAYTNTYRHIHNGLLLFPFTRLTRLVTCSVVVTLHDVCLRCPILKPAIKIVRSS